jgi:hypothetical protein
MSNYLGTLLDKRSNFLTSASVVEVDVKPIPQEGYFRVGKSLVAVSAAAKHMSDRHKTNGTIA